MEERLLPHRIPVFPLPNVIFFPNTSLPLHIFEARYRKMVSDCLEGDRYLGMILMKPGWEEGKIECYNIGGLGQISNAVKHPGGNIDIILQGLSRYRVRNYVQQEPYLIAEVDILEETGWEDSGTLHAAGEEMVRLFERTLYKRNSEVRKSILARLRLLESALDITNFLASILSIQFGLKQRVLETDDPEERVKLLTTVLRGELASLN